MLSNAARTTPTMEGANDARTGPGEIMRQEPLQQWSELCEDEARPNNATRTTPTMTFFASEINENKLSNKVK